MTVVLKRKENIAPYRAGASDAIIHLTPDTPYLGSPDDVQALDFGNGFVLQSVDYKYNEPIKHIPGVGFQFLQGRHFTITIPNAVEYEALAVHMVVTAFKAGVSPETIKPDGSVYTYDERENMVYTGVVTGSYSGLALNTQYKRLQLDWPNKEFYTNGSVNSIRPDDAVLHGPSTHALGIYFDNQFAARPNDQNLYGGSLQMWGNGRIVDTHRNNGTTMQASTFVIGRSVYGIIHEVIFYGRTTDPNDTLMPEGLTNYDIQKELMQKWSIVP